jgi:hypothetical protein
MVSVMTGRYWLGQMLVSDLVEMVRTAAQRLAVAGRRSG